MSLHLQREIEKLKKHLLSLCTIVEDRVQMAVRSLLNRDALLAQEVEQGDDDVDRREIEVEEDCLKILALYQPVAVDLRRTATVLKINTELERIADLAVNIAERIISLAEHPEFEIPTKLERMFVRASDMVHEALDAFVDLNVEAAREVCRRDDEVDDYNRRVIEDLLDTMRSRSDLVEAALHFFSVYRM